MEKPTGKTAFTSLKIAEFAWIVVGPSTSRYFAEHGATVVKIESHKRLDTNRVNSPFVNNVPNPDNSMFYGRHNPNKLSVSIDLKSPGGRELAWKLIDWADIVTESFSPGTMEKWGLGYEDVRKRKPDIIYFSSSMQGRGGPHSGYAGYGQNAVNFCGFTELTGQPDREPIAPYGAYTDYVCCRIAAFSLLAALIHREKTGRGQYVEQSQFESSIHFLMPSIMDYQVNGTIAGRTGNRIPTAAPHGVFPCNGADSWIAISIGTNDEWHRFCSTIEKPEFSADVKFATLEARKQHEDELEKIIADWTSRFTREEVESLLLSADIPVHRVSRPSDVYADPQLAARHYFTPLEHEVMGTRQFEPQSDFILSKTPRQVRRPSPLVGQHNEYVFKELLGMSDEEIADHIIDGSITTQLEGTLKTTF